MALLHLGYGMGKMVCTIVAQFLYILEIQLGNFLVGHRILL